MSETYHLESNIKIYHWVPIGQDTAACGADVDVYQLSRVTTNCPECQKLKSQATKREVSELAILYLIICSKIACEHLGEASNKATAEDWFFLVWLQARQKIDTLTKEQIHNLLTTAIEFDKPPDEPD